MIPNHEPAFSGYFKHDGTVGSIQAAVRNGTVARHYESGFVFIRGRGKLSAAECIAQRLMDQEAADYVAQQESCVGRPAGPFVLPPMVRPPAHRFEGTPIGDLVTALQTWSRNPMAQEPALALCEAFEAFQQGAAGK